MGDFPLVSVILPTYNGQQFISESIDSVLNQTHKNIELIIVNDASTDGTPAIIERYRRLDSRIKVINHKKNQKLPGSLNDGHKQSSGEFITWTSDDNYYHNNAIQRMIQEFIENPSIGMVYSDYFMVNSENQILEKVIVPPIETLSDCNVVGACFLYKKDVFDRTGFYSDKAVLAEDYDYWLRIVSRYPMIPLHEPLYYYRTHKDSISSQMGKDKVRLAADFALARNISNLEWLTNEQKIQKTVRIIKSAYSHHFYKSIPSYLFLAFSISPRLFLLEIFRRLTK